MDSRAQRKIEVQRAALLSVVAAAGLTIIKVVVGIVSGSLGVISEALHSLLDLAAAGITVFAVRKASEEADHTHQFGHGKVENFAALAETVLIWITAGWIFFEALRVIRLEEFPEPTIAGIAVMIVSIVVNYERSRVLYSTAEKHSSQALEADALHFITDAGSSIVVLIGLAFVWFGIPIADPLSAIGVAFVILFVSFRLAKRAVDDLVDRAPEGINEEIVEVCTRIPGVLECKRVRARVSGPFMFMDVVISIAETTSIDEAHHIADAVERALEKLGKQVDVMVHIEPLSKEVVATSEYDAYDLIYSEIKRWPEIRGIQKVRIHVMDGGLYIAADLEMQPELTLGKAHDISNQLERSLAERLPDLERVTFHLEADSSRIPIRDVTHERKDMVEKIKKIVEAETPAQDGHGIVVTDDGTGLTVSLDCRLDPGMSLTDSHDVADQIEAAIKKTYDEVTHVFVHIEPGRL
ncbi:MAG: cation diffusion facilitator family transporter [Candidatus Thorarchaeota archaeon]|jgi:cation diffusion facilitator family transporter